MFRNATARKLTRANDSRIVVGRITDENGETVTHYRPVRKPARGNVVRAAVNASLLDLTVR